MTRKLLLTAAIVAQRLALVRLLEVIALLDEAGGDPTFAELMLRTPQGHRRGVPRPDHQIASGASQLEDEGIPTPLMRISSLRCSPAGRNWLIATDCALTCSVQPVRSSP
jgi:hypothetical protein